MSERELADNTQMTSVFVFLIILEYIMSSSQYSKQKFVSTALHTLCQTGGSVEVDCMFTFMPVQI